ncbi:MAG TPA: flagellar FlbD family protein [Terriglobales bacterium]|nr:flagellar FlbD family protein [Terriglobales bacterium]
MIQLTRLNNSTLTINSDLIKFVEQSPDTVITLLNGEKILVRESVEQILDRIIQFRRRVLSGMSSWTSVGGLPVTHAFPAAESEGERG